MMHSLEKRCPLLLALLFLLTLVPCARAQSSQQRFRAMSYNVENLFDTCHDVSFDDLEFLPSAERHWDSRRYRTKLARIANVIAAVGEESPAELVALCEVENDSVVRDLVERTRLARLGYRFVMTHSRDPRGIDVALLYQPMRFRLLADTAYRMPRAPHSRRLTRDVLHVTGLLPTGDTLDVFVCHLPSRLGHDASYRLTMAQRLRALADDVMHRRERGLALMMGDFNDEYRDASISRGIGAVPAAESSVPSNKSKASSNKSKAFSNKSKAFSNKSSDSTNKSSVSTNKSTASTADWFVLSADLRAGNDIAGTYKYKGQWNELDQIIVSRSLLAPASPLHCTATSCRIFAPAFLLEEDTSRGGVKPRRTYLGPVYHNGYSDHLPLVVDFEMR